MKTLKVINKDGNIVLAELDPNKKYILVVNLNRVDMESVFKAIGVFDETEMQKIGIVPCIGNPGESIKFVEVPKTKD